MANEAQILACLIVIAVALLWGQVLREPLLPWWKRRDTAPPVVATKPSHCLRLLSPERVLEHELNVHAPRLPDAYTYAGKLYRFDRLAPDAPEDSIAEYRRT